MTTKELIKAVADGLASGAKVIDILRNSGESSMDQMRAITAIRAVAPDFWLWDSDSAGTAEKINALLSALED